MYIKTIIFLELRIYYDRNSHKIDFKIFRVIVFPGYYGFSHRFWRHH